jgi:hypothetical protein
MLKDRVSLVALVVAGSASVAAWSLPLKLNIVVAIAAAVVAGLAVDAMLRRHRPGASV